MEELSPRSRKKNPLAPSTALNQGRIPPQAIDMEEAVLGAMMVDTKGLGEVIELLHPEHFYKPEHQIIYNAIYTLFKETQPIDILTVSNQLRKTEQLNAAGGDFYLVQLSQKVTSSAHIEYHARIILEKYILRKLIEISSDVIDHAYRETTDVFELLNQAEKDFFEIANKTLKKGIATSENLALEALERIKKISENEGYSGIPSGFHGIDQITNGWQASDLIVIAARPGMGKTAFTLSMARNMAVEYNAPVAIFSLEMSALQLFMRLISGETMVKAEKLRSGKLSDIEWNQIYSKIKVLEDAKIFIDDQPQISVFDFRAKCRRLVSQFGIKAVIVDYLQLMTTGNERNFVGNRQEIISQISRSLKAIAKELEIPVIALSQLSRQVEMQAGHKRPQLSHLRESGAIEQDADIVAFIYRPEYYKIEYWDETTMEPTQGQAEFIIAKHRNGALGEVRLKFISDYAKFENLDVSYADMYPSDFQIESRMNQDLSGFDPKKSFGISDDEDEETNLEF